MDKKKVLVLSLLFLLIPGFVNAKVVLTKTILPDFEVKIVPIYSDVTPGQRALFNMTVVNNQDYADRFKIILPFGQWAAQTEPLYHGLTGMNIAANASESTLLYLAPRDIPYGHYALDITVQSETTEQAIVQYVNVYYTSTELMFKEYPPIVNVEAKLSGDGRFDPRSPQKIEVIVKNQNPRNLTDLTVAIKSMFFESEQKMSITPLGSNIATFPITFDPYTALAKDTLVIIVTSGEDTIGGTPIRIPFEVTGYTNTKRDISEEKKFLRSKTTIILSNDGNKETVEQVKLGYGRAKMLFTTADPKPDYLKENGKSYYTWSVPLASKETKTITVRTSYIPLFIIIIIAILISMILYFTRSPIIVTKSAKPYEGGEGIEKLRVTVHVKNRTGKPYKNVTVIDHVPKLITVDQKTDVGTMKPTKVLVHEKKGTLVMWELESLDEYEERIFSYFAKSKLVILGGLTLPVSIVKFKQGNRERAVSTKKVVLE